MSSSDNNGKIKKAYRFEEVSWADAVNVLGGISGGREGFNRRWSRMKEERPIVKKNFYDMLLPASLMFFGFLVWVIDSLAGGGSLVGVLLNESSYIGDFLVFHLSVSFIVSVYVAFSRKDAFSGRLARNFGVGFQFIPLLFVLIFITGLFTNFVVDNFLNGVYQVTSLIVDTGIVSFYVSSGPFVSPSQISGFMFLVGLVMLVPHFLIVFKAVVRVSNSNYEEMPEPEDIIDRDIYNLVSFEKSESLYNGSIDVNFESFFNMTDNLKVEPYEKYNEINRYWLRAPYSYAVILESEEENDMRYYVVEPEFVSDREELIMDEFRRRLEDRLPMESIDFEQDYEMMNEEKVQILENAITEIAVEYNIDFTTKTFHKILYYIKRDQVDWGKIDPLMNDEDIEDISCNGSNVPIYIFHRDYKDLETNIKFERSSLKSYIIQLAQRSGEHISRANPEIDASLPDGSRVQLSLSEDVTPRGPAFTIRKFEEIPFTPIDLINTGTFSVDQMTYLWTAIEYGRSLMFAGGTASGKTTSMNAVSLFIPPKSKIVSIEDTRELRLPHQNWVPSITREAFVSTEESSENAIDEFDLLRTALRRRPEYLVVGEIRGEEARTLFQAMNTGHTTYSTMHADSVESAIDRLENPPLNVPTRMIRALDIMCIQRQVRIKKENTDSMNNERRNEKIIELRSGSTGDITTETRFQWDPETDEFRGSNYIRDSSVLEKIRRDEGWDEDQLREEMEMRGEVLKYLLDNDIEDVKMVTRTIQSFMSNKEKTISDIREGEFDPKELESITSADYTYTESADPDKLEERLDMDLGGNNE